MGNTFVPELAGTNQELASSCDTTLLSGTISPPATSIIQESAAMFTTAGLVDTNISQRDTMMQEDHMNCVSTSFQIQGALQSGFDIFTAPFGSVIEHDQSYKANGVAQMAPTEDLPYIHVSTEDSPHHFSDQSTDNESCTSEVYKRLINRDYLARHGDYLDSPRRCLPSVNNSDKFDIGNHDGNLGVLDLNLDFTVHVGKLAIYLKQLKLSFGRMEEFVTDNKFKGKIKCILRNPGKSQRCTSNLFEAKMKDEQMLVAELDEAFIFYLFPKHQVDGMALQFKVYGKKFFRDITIAESFLRLGEIDLNAEMFPVSLQFLDIARDPDNRSKSGRKPVIVPKSGKLETLISLKYLPEKSKLVVDVRQSTKLGQLRDVMNREIIVQAELVSSTCECIQRKTTFLKMVDDNPGCNKPFEFDLSPDQLFVYTLMMSVSYSANRWSQQERIGWIAFGRHCSGQVEAQHWEEMLQKSLMNEAAVQWHCLCESQEQKGNTLLKVFK